MFLLVIIVALVITLSALFLSLISRFLNYSNNISSKPYESGVYNPELIENYYNKLNKFIPMFILLKLTLIWAIILLII